MSVDINQQEVKPTGYVWLAEPPIVHTKTNGPIDVREVQKHFQQRQEALYDLCQETASQLVRHQEQLSSMVGSCRVAIGGYKKDNFQSLVNELEHGETILVVDFNQIGGIAQEQIEMIEYARAKGILTLSLTHASLIGLPREAAFTLLDEWVIRDINRQLRPAKQSTTDQYAELVRLMKLGYSVTAITNETGWSRSTVFRLRRDHHALLLRDVPGFGDSNKSKSTLGNMLNAVRKVGRPRKDSQVQYHQDEDDED